MFLVGSLLLVGVLILKQINEEYAQNGSNWIISVGKNRKYVSNQHFIALSQKNSDTHKSATISVKKTGKKSDSFKRVWLDLRTVAFNVSSWCTPVSEPPEAPTSFSPADFLPAPDFSENVTIDVGWTSKEGLTVKSCGWFVDYDVGWLTSPWTSINHPYSVFFTPLLKLLNRWKARMDPVASNLLSLFTLKTHQVCRGFGWRQPQKNSYCTNRGYIIGRRILC